MSFALPDKNKALKWTLGVLGAIFVGALGSGVWQSLLAPAIHAIGRLMLDFVSLLWTNYKNQLYQQVAADNQSAISVEMLAWITTISALVAGLFTGYSRGYVRGLTSASPSPPFGIGTLRFATQLSSLFLTVLIAGQLISLEKLSYINSADAHYHQVMRVVLPYLDAGEQVKVESNFAQIASREDYVRVLSVLESKCKSHALNVPKFDPW